MIGADIYFGNEYKEIEISSEEDHI